MHHAADIDESNDKRKPEIIKFYNSTKVGVDAMDQKVSTYSCKRQTRSWPLVLLFNMLDVAAVNNCVIYSNLYPDYHANKSHRRRIFFA
jgi:hypothetical protein